MPKDYYSNPKIAEITHAMVDCAVDGETLEKLATEILLDKCKSEDSEFDREMWAVLFDYKFAGWSAYSIPVSQRDINNVQNGTSTDGGVFSPHFKSEEKQTELQHIFNMQRELMKKYGIAPEQLRLQGRGIKTTMLLKIGYATIREVIEILDELPWKWWRGSSKPVNIPKVKREVIDLFHFCIEFCIVVGMDAEEAYRLYIEKNSENTERIERESQTDYEDQW